MAPQGLFEKTDAEAVAVSACADDVVVTPIRARSVRQVVPAVTHRPAAGPYKPPRLRQNTGWTLHLQEGLDLTAGKTPGRLRGRASWRARKQTAAIDETAGLRNVMVSHAQRKTAHPQMSQ